MAAAVQVTRQRVVEGLVRLGYLHGSHALQQALQPRPVGGTAASALVPAIDPTPANGAGPLLTQPLQPDGTRMAARAIQVTKSEASACSSHG